MIDPLLHVSIRAAFALLFAVAVVHKLIKPEEFVRTIQAYMTGSRFENGDLGRVLAAIVIALELAAVVVALSPQVPRGLVSALIAGILLTYALAMYINIKRGRLLLDCGCSWGSRRQPVHIWLVARNAGLALVAVLLAPPVADRALSIIDCVSVVASLIVAAFLYAGTNQLLSIQSNVREAG